MTDQLPKLSKIDPAKLKLRELAEIERAVGRKLGGEFMSGDLGMDTMQALVWLELRRSNPQATFEQAGEYDMESLMAAFEDEEEAATPDPTGASSGERSAGPTGELNSRPLLSSASSGG